MDKTKEVTINKTPNSENNYSSCHSCLCSLNMLEHGIRLEDKQISIPFKR